MLRAAHCAIDPDANHGTTEHAQASNPFQARARRPRPLLPGRARRQHRLPVGADRARPGDRQSGRGHRHADPPGVQNLRAVAQAAGGELDAIVKLTILLADLADFAKVNEIMATYFQPPYPARATCQVAGLPKAARIEVDAILALVA
jgi:hypothetical protein